MSENRLTPSQDRAWHENYINGHFIDTPSFGGYSPIQRFNTLRRKGTPSAVTGAVSLANAVDRIASLDSADRASRGKAKAALRPNINDLPHDAKHIKNYRAVIGASTRRGRGLVRMQRRVQRGLSRDHADKSEISERASGFAKARLVAERLDGFYQQQPNLQMFKDLHTLLKHPHQGVMDDIEHRYAPQSESRADLRSFKSRILSMASIATRSQRSAFLFSSKASEVAHPTSQERNDINNYMAASVAGGSFRLAPGVNIAENGNTELSDGAEISPEGEVLHRPKPSSAKQASVSASAASVSQSSYSRNTNSETETASAFVDKQIKSNIQKADSENAHLDSVSSRVNSSMGSIVTSKGNSAASISHSFTSARAHESSARRILAFKQARLAYNMRSAVNMASFALIPNALNYAIDNVRSKYHLAKEHNLHTNQGIYLKWAKFDIQRTQKYGRPEILAQMQHRSDINPGDKKAGKYVTNVKMPNGKMMHWQIISAKAYNKIRQFNRKGKLSLRDFVKRFKEQTPLATPKDGLVFKAKTGVKHIAHRTIGVVHIGTAKASSIPFSLKKHIHLMHMKTKKFFYVNKIKYNHKNKNFTADIHGMHSPKKHSYHGLSRTEIGKSLKGLVWRKDPRRSKGGAPTEGEHVFENDAAIGTGALALIFAGSPALWAAAGVAGGPAAVRNAKRTIRYWHRTGHKHFEQTGHTMRMKTINWINRIKPVFMANTKDGRLDRESIVPAHSGLKGFVKNSYKALHRRHEKFVVSHRNLKHASLDPEDDVFNYISPKDLHMVLGDKRGNYFSRRDYDEAHNPHSVYNAHTPIGVKWMTGMSHRYQLHHPEKVNRILKNLEHAACHRRPLRRPEQTEPSPSKDGGSQDLEI